VVENLLHNAAKFTRAGDRVTISLSAGTETAEVIVADTGQGIEPKLLPRVFEPFVQGEPTLARTQGGLGLGLALVRGLVGLHGGAVRAESDGKGKGARFVVTVPLGSEPLPAPAPAATGPSARPRRVLVVDDNVDSADSLADFLRMLGHQVEVAYEGQDAIARVLVARPEVVLCDIGLPGMSGHAVARALRAGGTEDPGSEGAGAAAGLRQAPCCAWRAGGAAGLLLVALSGYGQPEDRKLALEAGFDKYLTKPASPEALEQLLG
jgi:CheY-like chemotaxis protein